MTTPKTDFDFQAEYDEYMASTPLEARFDPLTIQQIVVEASPKHQAYGMQFQEYYAARHKMAGYDESETRRMTFYFPSYMANVAVDLSTINKVSTYPFVLALSELGLIHAQVDYADDFTIAKDARLKIFQLVRSDEGQNRYMQLEKQTIELGSAVGARKNKAKHLAPSVPLWFSNAATELACRLNISVSDLIYFSWCYGIVNCLPHEQIPEYILDDISKVVKQFNYEIRQYSERIMDILKQSEKYSTTAPQHYSAT